MRYSNLFGKTRRDAPSEITDPVERLAYRAGIYRRYEESGLYLPLGLRTLARMEQLMRSEFSKLGAQELGGDFPKLGMLATGEIQSYKHLPARLFGHIYRTWFWIVALEPSPESARETEQTFAAIAAHFFEALQLQVQVAAHIDNRRLWFVPTDTSNYKILRCSKGDFVATREATRAHKPPAQPEALLPLEAVETPHCDTIESLAQFLGVPTAHTAKAVFYSSGGRVIFAVVRGDLQIDEEKLRHAAGLDHLRYATDDEIRGVGAVPGYASPIGVRGATIIVDDSIANSPNLVAGANREGYHLLNTNVPRDYKPDIVTDIALAQAGQPCPNGDGVLELCRASRLGFLTSPVELEATYLDANGRAQPVASVFMHLDLYAALDAYIAAHHDDKGIIWNRALAPYDVHIVALNADKPEVAAALTRVTQDLENAGVEYLLDDRNESAGVKFNDADLIGLPVRVTIGPRTVAQQAVEVKRRDETAAHVVPLDQVLAQIIE